VPIASIFSKLFVTVVLPLALGQIAKYSSIISSSTLKRIPFSTFRRLVMVMAFGGRRRE